MATELKNTTHVLRRRCATTGNRKKMTSTSTQFLVPRIINRHTGRQTGERIKINGRITKVIWPKQSFNHDGWSEVLIDGKHVTGYFSVLDRFLVYNIECIGVLSGRNSTKKWKIAKFLDPPFQPVELNQLEMKKLMTESKSMPRKELFAEYNRMLKLLKEKGKLGGPLEIEWIKENYQAHWLDAMMEKSLVFQYENIIKLSHLWSNSTLKRQSLEALQRISDKVRKDPMSFCFKWKNDESMPELSFVKFKECQELFGVKFEDPLIRLIYDIKSSLYSYIKSSSAYCLHQSVIRDHGINLQLAIKHEILSPIFIQELKQPWWFLKGTKDCVLSLVTNLNRILNYPTFGEHINRNTRHEKIAKVPLSKEQINIFNKVDEYNLLMILGPAGTGKTTLGNAIYDSFEPGIVLPLSYFGRVASNLRKQYGEGGTIHRLVTEIVGQTEIGKKLTESIRVIILDEISVITIDLLNKCITSLPLLSKIIMLGDDRQMTAPTPGSILNDFIEKYKSTGVVNFLTRVYRVNKNATVLLDNFDNIRSGNPKLKYSKDLNSDSQFVVLKRTPIPRNLLQPNKTNERIAHMKKDFEAIARKYNLDEVQIMTQKNTVRRDITQCIFEIKNGNRAVFQRQKLQKGDRLLFLENDYGSTWGKSHVKSDGVMNGEILVIKRIYDTDPGHINPNGKVKRKRKRRQTPRKKRRLGGVFSQPAEREKKPEDEEIDLEAEETKPEKYDVVFLNDPKANETHDRMVKFTDGRKINLSHYPITSIDMGFASTVASSQGSEYDVAIFYVHEDFTKTLAREQFYTAITRAKKRVILICDTECDGDGVIKEVRRIVENPYQHPPSVLKYLLPDMPQKLNLWD